MTATWVRGSPARAVIASTASGSGSAASGSSTIGASVPSKSTATRMRSRATNSSSARRKDGSRPDPCCAAGLARSGSVTVSIAASRGPHLRGPASSPPHRCAFPAKPQGVVPGQVYIDIHARCLSRTRGVPGGDAAVGEPGRRATATSSSPARSSSRWALAPALSPGRAGSPRPIGRRRGCCTRLRIVRIRRGASLRGGASRPGRSRPSAPRCRAGSRGRPAAARSRRR